MNIIHEVEDEQRRATIKFPTWPTDPLHALAILGEEFGELTKAMLQLTYEPHKTTAAEVRTEAIQTAAMALRLAMSLDVYKYQPSEQHSQTAQAVVLQDRVNFGVLEMQIGAALQLVRGLMPGYTTDQSDRHQALSALHDAYQIVIQAARAQDLAREQLRRAIDLKGGAA